MKHLCPICQRELKKEHMISYVDYHCFPAKENHHYSTRFKDDQMLQMKVRLQTPDDTKLFFKIFLTEGYTEVWTKINDRNRVKINQVFEPDFSQPEKLVKKILTYLIFS